MKIKNADKISGRIKMVCQRIEKQPVKHIPVLLGILILPEFQKQPKIQVCNIILIDQALVSTPCYN